MLTVWSDKVLTNLKGICTLNKLTDLTLDGIIQLTDLEDLDCYRDKIDTFIVYGHDKQRSFIDISKFAQFSKLYSVSLAGTSVVGAAVLDSLPNLEYLYLKDVVVDAMPRPKSRKTHMEKFRVSVSKEVKTGRRDDK